MSTSSFTIPGNVFEWRLMIFPVLFHPLKDSTRDHRRSRVSKGHVMTLRRNRPLSVGNLKCPLLLLWPIECSFTRAFVGPASAIHLDRSVWARNLGLTATGWLVLPISYCSINKINMGSVLCRTWR